MVFFFSLNRTTGSQNTVDVQRQQEAGVSLPPHRALDQGTPTTMPHCASTQLPLVARCHRHRASASSASDRPSSSADPTADLPPYFTTFLWGTEREKMQAEDIHQCFLAIIPTKLAPGRWSPGQAGDLSAALPAHACSLLYIRYNKAKAWIQKGLPLHWAGMRLEGCSELEKLKELHWIWGRTAGLFYEDSTGAQQLAHCFVWLHMWVFVAVGFCWFLLCCCFSFWFSFSFLLSHLNAHCQHLDEVGWWRGIWLSCWRCTGGKQDKKTTNKQKQQNREVRINIRMEQQIAITPQQNISSICCISRSCWLGLTRKVSKSLCRATHWYSLLQGCWPGQCTWANDLSKLSIENEVL